MKARTASSHLCRSFKRQCEALVIDRKSVGVLGPSVFQTKMRRHPNSFKLVGWQADLISTSYRTLLSCDASSDIAGVCLVRLLVDVLLVQIQGSAPSISSHALSELLSRCLGSRQALLSHPPPPIFAARLRTYSQSLSSTTRYNTATRTRPYTYCPTHTRHTVSADPYLALRRELTPPFR